MARYTRWFREPSTCNNWIPVGLRPKCQTNHSSGVSGRIWARTGCKFDARGIGKCQTGDCGGGLECDGNGAAPPTSLFEITLGAGNGQDYYDVSMVDGYNLPLLALPRGVYAGSLYNEQKMQWYIGCPKELQVVGGDGYQGVIGCRSACEALKLDKYCCSGEFANPNTCQPSYYSTIFKRACPRTYSYAFDDGTSTFTCKAYEYELFFVPMGLKNQIAHLLLHQLDSPIGSISKSFPHQIFSCPFQRQSFSLFSVLFSWNMQDTTGDVLSEKNFTSAFERRGGQKQKPLNQMEMMNIMNIILEEPSGDK